MLGFYSTFCLFEEIEELLKTLTRFSCLSAVLSSLSSGVPVLFIYLDNSALLVVIDVSGELLLLLFVISINPLIFFLATLMPFLNVPAGA